MLPLLHTSVQERSEADEISLHVHLFGPDLDVEHLAKIDSHPAIDAAEPLCRPINDHPFRVRLRSGRRAFQGIEMKCFADAFAGSIQPMCQSHLTLHYRG